MVTPDAKDFGARLRYGVVYTSTEILRPPDMIRSALVNPGGRDDAFWPPLPLAGVDRDR